MANDITNNPWIIDTAASTVISSVQLTIKSFYWDVGASGAADDALSVTDKDGKVKFEAHASAKNDAIGINVGNLPCHGLIVPTLAHGKLFVYLK